MGEIEEVPAPNKVLVKDILDEWLKCQVKIAGMILELYQRLTEMEEKVCNV